MTIFSDGTPEIGKAVLLAEDDPYLLAVAEQFGGMAAMNERSLRRQRASERRVAELPALLEQYPDQWAAIDEDGLVAVADTHEDLLKALADKGLYAGDLAIQDLSTESDKWLVL